MSKTVAILCVLSLVSLGANVFLLRALGEKDAEIAQLTDNNRALIAARSADERAKTAKDKLFSEAKDAAQKNRKALDDVLAAGSGADVLPELCRVLRETANRSADASGKPAGALCYPCDTEGTDANK